MSGLDWVFIGLYFALLLGITWWVIRRSKDTAADYFLASRNLGWFIVGASIFASNIGSEHLVGLAGAGATSGVALAHYELHAWCLLVLGWVFVPFYMRSMVYTMPEFLEKRFSPGGRWVLSIISLVAYVLTKFAVGIYAGGVVFATLLPDVQLRLFGTTLSAFWVGSVAVVALTGLYTVAGGMRGVAYTDAAQTIILIAGSVLITVFGLVRLGGWHDLRRVFEAPARLDLHHPWHDRARAGAHRQSAGVGGDRGCVRQPDSRCGAGGISVDGQDDSACRRTRSRRGGTARGINEFACGCVQRLFHALHDGHLPEAETRRDAASTGVDGPSRDGGDGADRAPLDSGHPRRQGTLLLPSGSAGVSRAADLHRLLLWRLHEASQRAGSARGAGRRLSPWRLPPPRGHASQPPARHPRPWLYAGLVPVDRQQHLFPVLQPVHLRRVSRDDGDRELSDAGAGARAAGRPDVRDGDSRATAAVPRELDARRRACFSRRARVDRRGVSLLPRLARDRALPAAPAATPNVELRP